MWEKKKFLSQGRGSPDLYTCQHFVALGRQYKDEHIVVS